MPEIVYPQESGEPVVVDLKDPYWAAFFAWAWPGAGHFYQRRYAKGFLFMICILSTYFFGLGIGQGRVVYASFKPGDLRWQFVCQLGVGAPALPAIIQSMKTKKGGDPYWVLCERFPADYPNSSLAFHKNHTRKQQRLYRQDNQRWLHGAPGRHEQTPSSISRPNGHTRSLAF